MTSFFARSCVFLLFALCFFADDRRVPRLSSLGGGGLLLAEACDPGKAGAQHEHECPPQEQLNQFIASLVPAYEKHEFWNFDHPKPVLGHRTLHKVFTFDGAERTSYQEIVDYARHVLHDAENIDFLTESSYFKKKYPEWLKTKEKKDEDKNKVKGKVNQEYIRLYDKYIKTAQHRKGSSFDEDVQEHPYAGGTLNIQEAMRNPLNKLAEDILKTPLATVAPVPVDIFDPVREEITRLVKQNDWFNFLRSRVQNTVTRPCPSADCSCAQGKSFRPYLGCEPHSGRRSMTPPARPSPISPTRSPLPSPVSSKGSPSMLSPKSRVTPLSPNHGVEFAHVLPN